MFTYQQALDYIYSFVDQEKLQPDKYEPKRFDLTNMHALLGMMGDPHRRLRAVHVAGTKGKGSTCAMTASILQAAGYKAGLFTQPHLHTFRERIQINGRLITEEEMVTLLENLKPSIEQLEEPSTFEIMTAMAFQYFAEHEVDFAVIETGLGGRLDTTNVIDPLVAVITSISYDHTYILGHTLEEIAGEKAGIIKEGRPVVCAPQQPAAEAVIVEACQQKQAPLILLGKDWQWDRSQADMDGQRLVVTCDLPAGGGLMARGSSHEFLLPFLGRYQLVNATAAIATVDQLYRQGIELSLEDVSSGLSATRWPGRLEILNKNPLLVIDGAHNVDSIQRLMAALAEDLEFDCLIVVAGFSADKDIAGMTKELTSQADELILTKSIHPRSADPAHIAAQVGDTKARVTVANNVASALWEALERASPGDLVCVTGSLFVVAEARAAWLDARGVEFERDPAS
ncbi:MAG TPA: folylpolyglutamate synthase/dihydrofolate synthase family protein [Anaerolineae bacterium]|nr:folylpolyglutamate synthase/dihydrofolate synthase family protein [Anaerolineae bacterium]